MPEIFRDCTEDLSVKLDNELHDKVLNPQEIFSSG